MNPNLDIHVVNAAISEYVRAFKGFIELFQLQRMLLVPYHQNVILEKNNINKSA